MRGQWYASEKTHEAGFNDVVLVGHSQQIFAERFKVKRLINVDAGHQVMNTRPQALAELLRFEAAADD